MAIDVNKALEIPNYGVAASDDDGNVQFYFCSGTGAPTGAAPVNSWYFRIDTLTLYYKYGLLDTDWRQLRAADITAMDAQMNPQTVQYMIDQIAGGGGSGVSQTAIFGDGGNTSKNSYLPNQGVQSNIVGVPVGITNAKIRNFFLGNDKSRTGSVYVRQRYPAGSGSWTNIYTANLSNDDFLSIQGLDVSITTGAEIAVFTTVSLKNVKVVLNINGDSQA